VLAGLSEHLADLTAATQAGQVRRHAHEDLARTTTLRRLDVRSPDLLYACVHNSDRSVAAKVLTTHHAGDRIEVHSVRSEPGERVNRWLPRCSPNGARPPPPKPEAAG
jgi:hypothetical protein